MTGWSVTFFAILIGYIVGVLSSNINLRIFLEQLLDFTNTTNKVK